MTLCYSDVSLDLAMEMVKTNGVGVVKATILSIDPLNQTTRIILESSHIDPKLEGKVVKFSITKDQDSKLIFIAHEI
jgi:Asp/Glu/hydantoin racemase